VLKKYVMLDLKKLEAEIDSLLANETAETYNELFKKTDLMGFVERVEISGGYTNEFSCSQGIIINTPNTIACDCDFYDSDLKAAA
jgi:hypothetical protein